VKLGVMYSGKELESETAEYKRYRLNEKALYGGIEETEELREALSQARRESLNDSSKRAVQKTVGMEVVR